MAASELRVQPQLAHALAIRGITAINGINKEQHTSGVAAPLRAKVEIFMASPENANDRSSPDEPYGSLRTPARRPAARPETDRWRWIGLGEARRTARGLLARGT